MPLNGNLRLSSREMKILKSIVGLVCLSAVVLLGQLLWTIHSAQECVASVRILVPGKSTLADVQALQHSYDHKVRVSGDCSHECSVGLVFESWLSRMHIIDPSHFEAHISVSAQTVAAVDLLYIKHNGMIVSVKERRAGSNSSNLLGFYVFVQDERIGSSKLQLTMRSTTPLEIRRTPMEVDLNCLGRSTCSNVQEVIPDLQSLRFSNQS